MTTQIFGFAITLGIALAGGLWALVQVVAKLTAAATRIEVQLEHLGPRVEAVEARASSLSGELNQTHQRITILETRESMHGEQHS